MTTNITTQPDTSRVSASTGGTWTTDDRKPVSRLRSAKPRRSMPHLLLGVLLVLTCGAASLVVSIDSGNRESVLALAQPVSAGQVLSARDLKQVNVAVDPGVSVVASNRSASVVGKTMSENLPVGTLLPLGAVSGTGAPVAGQALVALSLKAGQFPPEMSPGAHVSVVFAPGQAGAGLTSPPTPDSTTVWSAVIISLTTPPNEQITVVSVQVTPAAARQIAAIPAGQLSVVMLPGGGQ